MNYLLDTHTFLWFINDDPLLSPAAKALIESSENVIHFSVVNLWELAIKVSLGKLELPSPFMPFMLGQLRENEITLIGLTTKHIELIVTLPFHHRDPFDRLIIAQSLSEQMPIIGNDKIFDVYGVTRLW